jgi:hypothetical protein
MNKQIETTKLSDNDLDAVAGGWSFSVGSEGVEISEFGVTIGLGPRHPGTQITTSPAHVIGTCPR